MISHKKNKAVFLDRDGTLNKDSGYTYRIEQLELLPDVIEALKIFRDAGFLLIVVTNQSGVGRGYYTKKDVDNFNNALKEELKKDGIIIRKFYMCFHSPKEKCVCRKPSPYLINKAIEDFDIDPEKSFLFGDKESDIQSGVNAHVRSLLITEGHSLYFWAEKLKCNNFEI